MAGYSGKALTARLGLKAGALLLVVNAPAGYRELLAPLPDGARIATRASGRPDNVHHFATRRAESAKLPTDAVSEIWSGLKLVVRKELRGGNRS